MNSIMNDFMNNYSGESHTKITIVIEYINKIFLRG